MSKLLDARADRAIEAFTGEGDCGVSQWALRGRVREYFFFLL